jgi:N-acylglucosamine 2-epimerase
MFDKNFITAHKEELKSLYDYYKSELLEDIVPFWEPRIVDREYGGYLSCFDRKGNVFKDVKPGWFVGRNIYTFSYLYNTVEKRPQWLSIAAEGVEWMKKYAYKGNGRFNGTMARDGSVIDSGTNLFNDVFAIKGYYEYLVALGDERTDEQLKFAAELTDTVFKNARDTALLEKEGLPSAFRNHAVNFMTLLASIEGMRLFGERYADELKYRLHNAMYVFANDEYNAVFENVGADGKPLLRDQGRIMDPGHALESCWFSLRAGMELNDKNIIKRAGEVLDWIIDRGYDEENGGFILLLDVENRVPKDAQRTQNYAGTIADWHDKVWWTQAEGLNALALSALLNGNERHFTYFKKLHDYVDKHFRDHENGEWFSILSHDNRMLLDNKGFEGKGPYHVPRCVILLYDLFKMCTEL